MDITRSGSQLSGKGPAEHFTGNVRIDTLFEAPDPASAQHLPSYIERPSDAASIFAIWPGTGVPPGSEEWTWHEQTMQVPMFGSTAPTTMVRNVVIPTVTIFKPAAGTANGTSLIVAPGGAFRFLMMDAEGYDIARWLTQLGVTAFVLRYRVAHMPEDDGRQAIRFVRQHAKEWGLDPNRIGIAGFSAGGGIVMGTVMQHDAQSKPDFAAGIYPGYTTATPVPDDAPPLFIAIADDDILVAPISAARLYEAWHKAGKPVELHIFARGYHGFGMKKQNLPTDSWIDLFKNWLAAGNNIGGADVTLTSAVSAR